MNAILPPLILSVIAASCLLQADDNPTSWEHAPTFGLAASVPGRMKVVIQAASGETRAKEVVVPVPALAPYAKADLLVPIGSDWLPSGKPAKIDLILPSPTGVPLVATTTVTAP